MGKIGMHLFLHYFLYGKDLFKNKVKYIKRKAIKCNGHDLCGCAQKQNLVFSKTSLMYRGNGGISETAHA